MKVGDKVRCKFVAKTYKQGTTPGVKPGGIYLIESFKIQKNGGVDSVVISLVGQRLRRSDEKPFFGMNSFELIPCPTIRAKARAGVFKPVQKNTSE